MARTTILSFENKIVIINNIVFSKSKRKSLLCKPIIKSKFDLDIHMF